MARDYTTPKAIHPKRRKRPPMQPVVTAEDGYVRFQANRAVVALLDAAGKHGLDLNWLARQDDIPRSDYEQFAQLIGYSVTGFGELSYVSDAAYEKAEKRLEKLSKEPVAVDPITPSPTTGGEG